MDEALLRRLLGAAALLVLAFVVASLLPTPEPGHRTGGAVVYDLSTGEQVGGPRPAVENPPELKAEEALEQRPAQAPAPAAAEPQAPARRPALKVDETLEQPGGWFIQVGSFASQANARGALNKLIGMGLQPVIQQVDVGPKEWFRVRVGPFAAENAALAALGRIKTNGFTDARLVRPEADPARKGN